MVGIVFATADEAAPFAKQCAGRRPDEVEEGAFLRAGEVIITVTGPGKIKATLGTKRFLQQHDVNILVHAGGAAALTDELAVGTLVGATFVLEGDRVALDAPSYPRMPLDPPADLPIEGTLVSQDHTDDGDSEEQSYWERIADLRDETGYAVAYVAAQHGLPCHIVKGITHRAGAEAGPTNQRTKVGEAVATFLQQYLEALTDELDS